MSHTVNEKYYRDLPIVTGADVRLAESVLQMQPGYLPMKPNGDPMFRGSQFNSRINGGQTMATENFFDGAAFGYAVGHQQSHESTPPVEAVQEVKVISTTYSAQYGHTSGGFIEYTSKSGTNAFHGSGYEYFADDAFNANGFFAEQAGSTRRRCATTTSGSRSAGPWSSRSYNGRNKTFFFTNIDYTRIRSGTLSGLRQHDADRRVQERRLQRAAHGQADRRRRAGPADLRGPDLQSRRPRGWSTACPCAIRIPNNLIPANDPLRSVVASPDRAADGAARIAPGSANNVAGNPAGDQTWELDARNIMFRIDHNFTPNFRASHSFYWNRRPVDPQLRRGRPAAPSSSIRETESAKNTDYYGDGFFQRISTHHAHQQFDWIISNNLLNHSTVAWDRWFMGGNSSVGRRELAAAAVGGHQQPSGGIRRHHGRAAADALRRQHPLQRRSAQNGWPSFGYEENNRWQFSNDLTWVKGRHTLKTGFEFRHHNFPYRGWAAGAAAGQFNFNRLGTGGLRRQRQQPRTDRRSVRVVPARPGADAESDDPGAADVPRDVLRALGERRVQGHRQADADPRDALRLPVGPHRDDDQYSTFDPNTPNPGAGRHSGRADLRRGRPGAGGHAEVRRRPEGCLGSARGLRLSDRRQGRDSRRLRDLLRARRVRPVHRPADDRVPGERSGQQRDERDPAGVPTWTTASRQNRIVQPPFIDPSQANGTGVIAVAPDGLTLPRFQNWSVTYQHQLTEQHDAGRVVHRQSRLPPEPPLRAHGRGRQHERSERAGARYSRAAGGHQFRPCAQRRYPDAVSDVHRERGAGAPRSSRSIKRIIWRGVPLGESQYHAFEAVLERRFSRGLQARVGYTFSRLKNNGAESAQGDNGINGGVQNPANPLEWRSAPTTCRTCCSSGSRGRCPGPQSGARRRPCWAAGTSPASSATRAGGR